MQSKRLASCFNNVGFFQHISKSFVSDLPEDGQVAVGEVHGRFQDITNKREGLRLKVSRFRCFDEGQRPKFWMVLLATPTGFLCATNLSGHRFLLLPRKLIS